MVGEVCIVEPLKRRCAMRRYLIITTLLFGLMAVAQTPNHNAVLITGDTPEASDHSAVVAEFQL